jgi:hypothetical protein
MFPPQLTRAINESTFFLLILSPGCLAPPAEPRDWVRNEVEVALSLGKPIVPIFLDDFRFEHDKTVPQFYYERKIHDCHGIHYPGPGLDGFTDELLRILNQESTRK